MLRDAAIGGAHPGRATEFGTALDKEEDRGRTGVGGGTRPSEAVSSSSSFSSRQSSFTIAKSTINCLILSSPLL